MLTDLFPKASKRFLSLPVLGPSEWGTYLTKWTNFEFALATGAAFPPNSPSLLRAQERVHLPHDVECVGHIEDVGLPPRPPAIGIEIDRPAFIDEPPADGKRLFAVIGRSPLELAT